MYKLEYDIAKKTNLINIMINEKKNKSRGQQTVNIIYRKFTYEQS